MCWFCTLNGPAHSRGILAVLLVLLPVLELVVKSSTISQEDAEGLSVTHLLVVKPCCPVPLCSVIPSGMSPGTQKPEGELEAVRNYLFQCIS